MRRGIAILVGLTCFLAVLAAGGANDPKKSLDPQSELAQAPEATRSRKNPYEGRPEAIQAGKLLYDRHCARCHGAEGKGHGKAPNLQAPAVKSAAPGTLFWFLRNGNLKEGMPSWSNLPDQQLWQLVSFLQSGMNDSPPRAEK